MKLFFGAEIHAPWPDTLPGKRIVSEEMRHITFHFLGSVPPPKMEEIPLPPFVMGPSGVAKGLHFLQRAVALGIEWLDPEEEAMTYQGELANWLLANGYRIDQRTFFPHITLARAPFDEQEWEGAVHPLPFYIPAIHLYQSGQTYQPIWTHTFISPFEEISHTADIAFKIRGRTVEEIHRHGALALAFHFPDLLSFWDPVWQSDLDEVIIALNRAITRADATLGCPLKAVSFHGKLETDPKGILSWEMIVDV